MHLDVSVVTSWQGLALRTALSQIGPPSAASMGAMTHCRRLAHPALRHQGGPCRGGIDTPGILVRPRPAAMVAAHGVCHHGAAGRSCGGQGAGADRGDVRGCGRRSDSGWPLCTGADSLSHRPLAVAGALYLRCALVSQNYVAYGWVLAGFTAWIIGIGASGAPTQVFNIAVARVSEITLGVGCALFFSTLILPERAAAEMLLVVQATRRDLVDYLREMLLPAAERVPVRQARRRLMGGLLASDTMRGVVAFETRRRPGMARPWPR